MFTVDVNATAMPFLSTTDEWLCRPDVKSFVVIVEAGERTVP